MHTSDSSRSSGYSIDSQVGTLATKNHGHITGLNDIIQVEPSSLSKARCPPCKSGETQYV
jgi:hypothetical protein